MKIIAGKFKRIKLKSSKSIRPTEAKVKKSLFDILGDLEGVKFLDLFAGSGAVGIEALSRGAEDVVFVEKDKGCCEAIEDNLSKVKQGVEVLNIDTQKALDMLSGTRNKFDIIFLDPPYYKDFAPRLRSGSKIDEGRTESLALRQCSGSKTDEDKAESLVKKTLQKIASYDILSPSALVIVQHYKKDILDENIGKLTRFKIKKYGDTVLSFYQK